MDRAKKRLVILNRVSYIEFCYLEKFTKYIFIKHRIRLIQIEHQLYNFSNNWRKPYLVRERAEDFIIRLPSSIEEYEKRLSSNMRRHTRNYISKINRELGELTFNIYKNSNIPPMIIHKIVEMNHQRMINKKIISGLDESYVEKILRFINFYGYVTTVEIQGSIVAGTITYSISNNYFVEEIASDPAFDKYDVGHTCLFLTIKECINQHGNEFHLLWGNNPYKTRFLGERSQLYSAFFFRSHFSKYSFYFRNIILPQVTLNNITRLLKKQVKIVLGQKIVSSIKNQF